MSVRIAFGTLLAFCIAIPSSALADSQGTFNSFLKSVESRPQFTHTTFGVAIYSLDRKTMLYETNGKELFIPASTTKLLTEASALHFLGPNYRFHTPIYRTGPIENGILKGNLILVASGDPNLSGRMEPDGTLAFSDEDHTYGGLNAREVGDPLAALKKLADQILATGIRQVDGSILVDASLFPEGQRELGSHVVLSPIVVNDNVIDVFISPGSTVGSPAQLRVSPQPYSIHFINQMSTGPAASKLSFKRPPRDLPDGSLEVTLRGSIPLGSGTYLSAYSVPSPSRFAAELLTSILKERGVTITSSNFSSKPIGDQFKSFYTPENRVAELISAPLREDTKVTLKVSQNLHASTMPYVVGAVVGKARDDIDRKGFELEHQYLAGAGLDLSGASQADGAGGAALFAPDFMARFLAFMTTQPDFGDFRSALPVLGKDGTLFNIQTSSPAMGKVFAKTGTFNGADYLNNDMILTSKALAGYTTGSSGEKLAFALYINNVPLDAAPNDPVAIMKHVDDVGQIAGEIAVAIHLRPIEQTNLN